MRSLPVSVLPTREVVVLKDEESDIQWLYDAEQQLPECGAGAKITGGTLISREK